VEVDSVFVEERTLTYLYRDGENYHFMDSETFEQVSLHEKIIGEAVKYLKENMEVTGLFCDGKLFDITLPVNVDLKVVEAEPGVKGDTAQGGKKRIKLETGITIQSPLFVESGDTVTINTKTGEYATRAK
jgi:elongation factor P